MNTPASDRSKSINSATNTSEGQDEHVLTMQQTTDNENKNFDNGVVGEKLAPNTKDGQLNEKDKQVRDALERKKSSAAEPTALDHIGMTTLAEGNSRENEEESGLDKNTPSSSNTQSTNHTHNRLKSSQNKSQQDILSTSAEGQPKQKSETERKAGNEDDSSSKKASDVPPVAEQPPRDNNQLSNSAQSTQQRQPSSSPNCGCLPVNRVSPHVSRSSLAGDVPNTQSNRCTCTCL